MPETKLATFAGGCFWCMEPPYAKLDGVVSVTPGYTGGHVENPTYEQVCTGGSGHFESVQVVYDPEKVIYEDLLDAFWRNIDPTQADGQFADRGKHYRTAIFYHDEEQRAAAEASKAALDASGRFADPVVTLILPAKPFYPAEDYHQQYYLKNAAHYTSYSLLSGRKPFIEQTWKDEK